MSNKALQKPLGELEQAILMSIAWLDSNAYGVSVQDEVEKRTGREFSTGAIYTVLSRLEDKGFVESHLGEATAERGGRRKRMYTISPSGKRALDSARQYVVNLWGGLLTG